MGLNVMEVSKDIEAGVDSVKALFKQNRIHIHPDCKNLIYELETYHYPDKKPEQNEKETPVKENDHLMDCLRYALHNYKTEIKRPNLILNRPKNYV
jgi:phage terminase large subunit